MKLKSLTNLALRQLDEQLANWNSVKKQSFPKKGWVNLIRSTLGLSSYQLAKRMRVNQARVMQIEEAERNSSITLKTLKKAAEAMGCKLVYGIIPQTSLKDVLKQQACKIAKQRINRVSHSMDLEAQGIEQKKQKEQFELLVQELLEESPKKLWSDN